jgi:hypothetical protein
MTEQATIDPEAVAELDAYRAGYCQLAWDPHTADSPHQISRGYGTDEPTTYVQHTYEGRPAWLCSVCLKVTLAEDVADGAACQCCGNVDTLGALLYDEPCGDETHQEVTR